MQLCVILYIKRKNPKLNPAKLPFEVPFAIPSTGDTEETEEASDLVLGDLATSAAGLEY